MPALHHYPTPIDFGDLQNYLWTQFQISNFAPVNHDASVTSIGVSEGAHSFDRAKKPDGGVLLMECKAPGEKELSIGQELHLKHWHEMNPRKITVLVVQMTGETLKLRDQDGTNRTVWKFVPQSYRIFQRYQHQGVVKTGWRTISCTPEQFYASMAGWYKTGTWNHQVPTLRSVA